MNRLLDERVVDDEGYGGEFTLGGTNSTFYDGDIEFLDFPDYVRESFWLLEVTREWASPQLNAYKVANIHLQALLSRAKKPVLKQDALL